MQFNLDPEWLRRMADAEDNCDVAVGSTIESPLQPAFVMDLLSAQPIDTKSQQAQIIRMWQEWLVELASRIRTEQPSRLGALPVLLHQWEYSGDELSGDFDYLIYRLFGSRNKISISLGIGIDGIDHYYWNIDADQANWHNTTLVAGPHWL